MNTNITAVIPALSSFYLDRLIPALDTQVDRIVIVKAKDFENSIHVNRVVEQAETPVLFIDTLDERKGLECLRGALAENAGIKHAETDYIAIMNQDVQPFPGSLDHMKQVMEDDPEIGIIGAAEMTIDVLNGRYLKDTGRVCRFDNVAGQWPTIRQSGFVDALSFFCVLIQKKCFEDMGGFSDEYQVIGEDVDFCWKALQKGWKTYYCREAEVFHVQGSAIQEITDRHGYMDDLVKLQNKVGRKSPVHISKVNRDRLHVLGLAHTRTHQAYSYCAFTTLTRYFCRMMKKQGYEIIFYGVEGSDVDCDEFVQCLSDSEYRKTYSDNENHKYQYRFNWQDGDAWPTFARNVEDELKRRIGNQKEMVIVGGGGYHSFAGNIPNTICVDPHVGHKGPWTKYRVFPSKTWRAFYYGLNDEAMCKQQYPPVYWNDAVIYHYLDMNEFEFNAVKQDFALFIGRLNQDKGVYEVMKACDDLGIPLYIAGANHPDTESIFLDQVSQYKKTEYLGTLNVQERAQWMAKAKCVITPTLYNEPFGLVAIEAQACGTPVIATDWGGFCETVIDGTTGFRCSYFNDIKTALENIDLIDQGICRKWIHTNFNAELAGDLYKEYFERVFEIESTEGNAWYLASVKRPLIQDLIIPSRGV